MLKRVSQTPVAEPNEEHHRKPAQDYYPKNSVKKGF